MSPKEFDQQLFSSHIVDTLIQLALRVADGNGIPGDLAGGAYAFRAAYGQNGERYRDEVRELRSALAESYAPCRECGEPPQEWKSDDGLMWGLDCSCGPSGIGEKSREKARAAWNEANRK